MPSAVRRRYLKAKEGELQAIQGITKAVVRSLKAQDPYVVVKKEQERTRSIGVEVIGTTDSRSPHNLLEIYDPPLVLHVKGELR